MRRIRGRHCPDCGAALVYYPHLSSPRAPDGQRVLVYSCPECTDDFERPRMVAVRLGAGGDGDSAPIESVDVVITERAPAPGKGNARGGGGSGKSSAGAASPNGAEDGG